MIALHRRFRWWVPVVMVAGRDLRRRHRVHGGWSPVRWCNVAFVLLLPHQLGFFYADGTFVARRRRRYGRWWRSGSAAWCC